MASIGKLPTGSYRIQYYVDGKKRSKTFKTRLGGLNICRTNRTILGKLGSRVTFGKLMEEYRDTVTVTKRGAREETIRINRLMKYPIADVVLSKMTAGDIQNFIDTRGSEKSKTGEQISPVTVIREYCHIIGV